MRQATGIACTRLTSTPPPHALKGADSYRTINEKLDELRLVSAKDCRRLADEGQLSNATLAPLLKAAVVSLAGKLARPAPPAAAPAPSTPGTMRGLLLAI